MSLEKNLERAEAFKKQVAEANANYASSEHKGAWHFNPFHKPTEFRQLPAQPAVQIVTCMDPRCNPDHFWRFKESGDLVPAILRNAGGRVTEDMLRSMRVLTGIAGSGLSTLGVIAVVHHTDCGMLSFPRDLVESRVRANTPSELKDKVQDLSWGFYNDLDASVKEDVALIRADPFLSKDIAVLGFVYDVDSGEVREVEV